MGRIQTTIWSWGCLKVCGTTALAGIFVMVVASALMASRESLTLCGHTGYVNSVAFSKDGKILASGSEDTTIKLWDAEAGKEVATLEPPEGRYLGSEKSKGTVYDPITGQPPPFVTSISVSPDAKTLASGATDRTIRLWNIEKRQQVSRIELEYSGPYKRGNIVFGVAFGPDGKTIASASFDGVVRLWSVETGKLIRALRGHTDTIYAVTFSPDGKTLASCGCDQTIRLWDAESGEIKQILKGHTCYVRCVAFSSDGRYLASGGGDVYREIPLTELKLWEMSSGKELAALGGHEGPVHGVAFSPDGKILASGGGNQYAKEGEVLLWDLSNRKELLSLKGHGNLVESVAFSLDGKLLASGSMDKTIRIWDVGKILEK